MSQSNNQSSVFSEPDQFKDWAGDAIQVDRRTSSAWNNLNDKKYRDAYVDLLECRNRIDELLLFTMGKF